MSCEIWWSGELQAQRVRLAMAAAGHQIQQTLGHSIKNFDLLPSPALPWELLVDGMSLPRNMSSAGAS